MEQPSPRWPGMKSTAVAVLGALAVGTPLGCGGPETPAEREPADRLFLTSHNASSNRHAILEDDGQSCWLYLTEAGGQRPEKDCFVYSPIEPVSELDREAIKSSGAPPVLTKDVASSVAVLRAPLATDFSFAWSEDGESVVVMHRGTATAMIVSGEKRGYSRALARAGLLGEPWSDSIFARFF